MEDHNKFVKFHSKSHDFKQSLCHDGQEGYKHGKDCDTFRSPGFTSKLCQ